MSLDIAGYARRVARGLVGDIARTITTPTQQAQENPQSDWRVRLALSGTSNYLYNAKDPGILAPLKATSGVIFPYTPTISVNYNASYSDTELVHSNYKIYQYKNSSVDSVSITCDFTAQDTYEADYMLAVIHFFRSATKMFYGQDNDPLAGTPPPLCFLYGLGAYQFDKHPLVISNFQYQLPNNVDYIRADITSSLAGVLSPSQEEDKDPPTLLERIGNIGSFIRLGGRILPGGNPVPPVFSPPTPGSGEGTYVPTKITMTITANPVVSRNEISNEFSLRDYASGKLLKGSQRPNGGGMW
jgi:hypothetical protein